MNSSLSPSVTRFSQDSLITFFWFFACSYSSINTKKVRVPFVGENSYAQTVVNTFWGPKSTKSEWILFQIFSLDFSEIVPNDRYLKWVNLRFRIFKEKSYYPQNGENESFVVSNSTFFFFFKIFLLGFSEFVSNGKHGWVGKSYCFGFFMKTHAMFKMGQICQLLEPVDFCYFVLVYTRRPKYTIIQIIQRRNILVIHILHLYNQKLIDWSWKILKNNLIWVCS